MNTITMILNKMILIETQTDQKSNNIRVETKEISKIRDNYLQFNTDELYEDTNFDLMMKKLYTNDVEIEIKKRISFECEVYVYDKSSASHSQTLIIPKDDWINEDYEYKEEQVSQKEIKPKDYISLCLTQKYLIIEDDMMYLYNNKHEKYIKYSRVFFLKGCFALEKPEELINKTVFYSTKVFFLNNNQETFYFKDKKTTTNLFTKIRDSALYKNFFSDYKFSTNIGVGAFGEVFLTKSLTSNEVFATKIIKKNGIKKDDWQKIKNEIDILQLVDHPNIIKFKDLYENSEFYFIITEYLKFGSLTTFISTNIIKESTAKCIIKQLASALKYLNGVGIIHRDLKPDNIMIQSKTYNNEEVKVKLIDFGLAKFIGKNETTSECCETIPFCAPELLNQDSYNYEVDIWSLGINTYYLLTETFPFKIHKTKKNMLKCICKDSLNMNILQVRSLDAVDFIMHCLKKNSKKRMNIDEVLDHPWLK